MEFTRHEKDTGRDILRTRRASLAEVVAWGQLEGLRFKGVLSRIVKASNDVFVSNKGAEGALTAKGSFTGINSDTLLPCHSALYFPFFTSNLSTLHCLGQVLFFFKVTHFAKHVMGMKQSILFKRCCICGLSVHRIARYHTTMWTNFSLEICIVIIR